MARAIPPQTRTPADELRDLLAASYAVAVNSADASPDALKQLLFDLDRIQRLFPRLEAQGMDLRPERVTWQEVQGAVRRHGDDIVAGVRPLGGLKALREALPHPPDPNTRWWWRLDESQAAARRRRVLLTLALLAGVLLLIAGGVAAFQRLFPVDEKVTAAYEHKLNAENDVVHGRFDEAIQELEAARALTPDDPDILSLLAALYDLTGQNEKRDALIAQLRDRYPQSTLLSNLAQSYLLLGEVDRALMMTGEAAKADPANPQSYLIAGMAYEAKGDVRRAMESYQIAAQKANAADDYQTEAFAKVRLANLLQKPHFTPTP